MNLEEVSRKTGIPLNTLRQQQMAVLALRAKRPVSVGPSVAPVSAPTPIPYSPTAGPLRLQKQMYDAGV